MWDEITYPLPNFNGCTVEVSEWIYHLTHTVLDVRLFIHAEIKVNPCQWKGPLVVDRSYNYLQNNENTAI